MSESDEERREQIITSFFETLSEEVLRQYDEESSPQPAVLDQLYYKHVESKEESGDIDSCREFLTKWFASDPTPPICLYYINFELRQGRLDRARALFEFLVQHHPTVDSWIRFAEFEFRYGSRVGVRICCDRAINNLQNKEGLEFLILAFAEFEDLCNELENATRLYKSVLARVGSKEQAEFMYKKVVDFENRRKDKNSIVKIVLWDKRAYFEEVVKRHPMNYDVWYDYIFFEETVGGDVDRLRLVYKRALANVPSVEVKSFWRKYVYLCILYALFEEIDAKDIHRTRQAYKDCIRIIPHKKLSFSKIWLLAAEFEIRQLLAKNARQVLGCAIRVVPKENIFRMYIDMELQLGDVQRCRHLYRKYVQWSPDDSCNPWIECAEFEIARNEPETARFIFERAIRQASLHGAILLWEAYTNFEVSQLEISRPRALYVDIIRRHDNLNARISHAKFEAYGVQEIMIKRHSGHVNVDRIKTCLEEARRIFRIALKNDESFNSYISDSTNSLQDLLVILNEWLDVERSFGDLGDKQMVLRELPWGLRKRLSYDRRTGKYKED